MTTITLSNQSMNVRAVLRWTNVLLLFFIGLSLTYKAWEPMNQLEDLVLLFGGTFLSFTGLHLAVSIRIPGIREIKIMLILSTVVFVGINLMLWPNKDYLPEQLLEHSLQIFLPLSLALMMNRSTKHRMFVLSLKAMVALTFVGHGLYALGWHVLPEHFLQMTGRLLPFDRGQSEMFLFSAGLLDVLVAVLIFIKKTSRVALIYMVIWGFLTALARPLSNLDVWTSNDFWFVHVPGMFYRLPHAIIPWIILSLSPYETSRQ